MNRRPGHVEVTTEVGYCSFCDRTRNLRREDHHLGALVRTIVTCETCHRTLSSSIGVAATEPVVAEKPAEVEAVVEAAPVQQPAKPKRAPVKRAPAKRATKAAGKPAKPTSTATRKVTRKK